VELQPEEPAPEFHAGAAAAPEFQLELPEFQLDELPEFQPDELPEFPSPPPVSLFTRCVFLDGILLNIYNISQIIQKLTAILENIEVTATCNYFTKYAH
jgi:hypothetical protein